MPDDASRLPRISVIIAMRDAAGTLVEQLEALTQQTYTGWWEVLLVDNGSTDAGCDLGRSYEGRLRNLRVIDASERPGCAHARNVAAVHARGEVLAFCDADDVVSPGWLGSTPG
jgi:glycosyltransferase involved in cell wall biosynthesis